MEDLGHALLVPSSLAWKFVSEALQFLFLITHKTPLPHLGSPTNKSSQDVIRVLGQFPVGGMGSQGALSLLC